jgi:hypothetical protein
MKKYLAVIAVLALTMVSSAAMAEITFDGSIEFLMRSIKNTTDWNDDTKTAGDYNLTYERVRFGINAKHDNVKGRIQIENDWDIWGDSAAPLTGYPASPGFETRPNNPLSFREAWLDFTIPGIAPAHIKVGRQFLQLGNGWWFRSNKYGSDAWVVGLPGKNTIAFVNVKAAENTASNSDDTDAYVLLDTFKIDDTKSVGAYIAHVTDRNGVWTTGISSALFGASVPVDETTLDNIGLWFNGKFGAVNLAAEVDYQMGEVKALGETTDIDAWQAVLQANMAMDALTLKATAAMGTGDDPNTDDWEEFIPFVDKDPHYTLVYEYYMRTAAGRQNTAFANTLAVGIGALYQVNKMIGVGVDGWWLDGDQEFSNNGGTADSEIGTEVDVTLNLKLYDQLTWNTVVGIFMPGKGYENATGKADDATAVHSVLSYKF